jgi:hypothetical protein
MATKKEWIPTRELELVVLIKIWLKILSDEGKQTLYGWIKESCTETTGILSVFLTKLEAFEADDSTANLVAKKDAKVEAIDAMRDFANSFVRFNKKMQDEDKLVLGIHPSDSTPTYHGPPTSQPDVEVESTHNRYEHKLRAINRVSADHSKPEDAYGVRYAWQVGGEKPASGADLPKNKFSRKTTFVITYTEAEKTKIVYYAACYENSKGDEGSWSTVVEAVIG